MSAADKPVEIPWVAPHPRNGTYTTYREDGKVHVTGEYRDGLRQGSWKSYWPSGALQQDYGWDRGLKQGAELDWTEAGVLICEGRNEAHVRRGRWTWWHEDGTYREAYAYDEGGLAQGPYRWDLADGSPRARGAWWNGKRDGVWEWHHEPAHERVVRGYQRGRHHGEEAAWFHGGHLAYRRFWHQGDRHGEEESYHPDGTPAFKGQWHYGIAVGEHHTWSADGVHEVVVWEQGLVAGALSEKKLAALAKKLGKGKDNWAKQDVLDKAVGWSGRMPLAYRLWKEGLYDLPRDPELWDLLVHATGLFSGQDVIDFLKASANEDVPGGHLPGWPSALDVLVMRVYALDPGPIDAAWETLPDLTRKGVAFVLARFGKDIGDALSDEMGALAKRHADYGTSSHVWWPTDDGHAEWCPLWEGIDSTPTELFDEFLAIFGTVEQWTEALRPYALTETQESVARVGFPLFRWVIEAASVEEMTRLCEGISLDGQTDGYIHRALWEWRGDDGATMAEIALGIDDTGLRKWPAVCAAILKLHQEGNPIPQALVDCFELAVESPTYSSEWSRPGAIPEEFRNDPHHLAATISMHVGASVPRARRVHEALRALSEEQVRAIFERCLAIPSQNTNPAQYLYLLDDPELWEQVIHNAEQSDYGYSARTTWGFGDIGLPVVPLLEAAQERATKKNYRYGWAQAIICALTRAAVDGVEIPERYDRHIRFDVTDDDYDFRFLQPFLRRLIYLLPADRAEKVLLAGLHSDHYWRALAQIASHPTQAVVTAAFERLLQLESSMSYEQGQNLTMALRGLPNTEDWVTWVLSSGGGAGCREALQQAVGSDRLAELERALSEQGLEPPKQLDAIDKLVELAAKSGGGGEQLYLLRRLDAQARDDLNVIGGAAPGVAADRWPMRDDGPMSHLFTLDLSTMPELQAAYDARTLSVFCFQPDYNEAWEPGNDWTAVVLSTQEQIDAGGAPPDDVDVRTQAWFEVVALRVDMSDDTMRTKVYQASARVLGEPIWLQDEQYYGEFVMQFDESFAHMNLGDMGVMYVFDDTAFWQCH